MKWLFLLMVAVNIAIFVWGVQRETETATAGDPRYSNIGEIKLLSKAEIQAQVAVQASENENIDESTPVPEQQFNSEEAIAATTLDIAAEAADPEPELSVEQEAARDVNSASSVQVSESAATEIPPKELADASTHESPQLQSEEPETAGAELTAVPEIPCWTLGPIDKRPAALIILEAVKKENVSADLREEVAKDITGFWVVLPPYENASAAIEVVNILKARDVLDVQRFYRGELQNGVSLGIYNQRYNAEKRRQQIETKGFSPEVIPRYKEELRYWIDYSSESEVTISRDMPTEYSGLVSAKRECGDPLD